MLAFPSTPSKLGLIQPMNFRINLVHLSCLGFVAYKIFKKDEPVKPSPKKIEPQHQDRTQELILFLRNNQHSIKTKEQIRDILLMFNLNFDSSNPELIAILNEINEKINAQG